RPLGGDRQGWRGHHACNRRGPLARIRSEIELMPAMSVTEAISVISVAPASARVSPAVVVESINFGTPTGSARIALVAITVFPDPQRRLLGRIARPRRVDARGQLPRPPLW